MKSSLVPNIICVFLVLDFSLLLSITLTDSFDDPYYHFIFLLNQENGNSTINNIVSQTQYFNNSPIRVTKIANLIVQNFSDTWWSYQKDRFCQYTDLNGTIFYNWCSPWYGTLLYNVFNTSPNVYIYSKNKLGNVTTYQTNDLSNNPEWIAYQKAGNCQAISVFFNETLNRSGFVSRVVRAKGFDHVWDEVQINKSWRVFDIQTFGNFNGTNINASNYWDADPKIYYPSFGTPNVTIYTFDLSDDGFGENITELYYPNN
jgi:hypothetical protein